MYKYKAKIEELAKHIASEMHISIYDIEEKTTVKGKVIVVFITKVGGVTLSECATFSRKLSEELDNQDFIQEKYFLEISSPGIERNLKLKIHYITAINELVEIMFNENGKKRTLKGILSEVNPDNIVVIEKGMSFTIPFSNIYKAKTCFSVVHKKEQQ